MGKQIQPATLGDLHRYLSARLAVDSMVQTIEGPQVGDKVN
jgi:hypothetical protein